MHKALKFIAPLAIAAAAVPMAAQMPMTPFGKPDPALVTAGTYAADPGHTLVGWKVNHLGFNDYFGLFGTITGTLVIDPAHVSAAKVDMTVPVKLVTTASPGLTAHLLRAPKEAGGKPDFFGPTPADAHFVSTAVAPGADGKTAAITGNLTLNGVTKPVTIAATFAGAGTNMMGGKATVGFHGTATIKRSDFGITTFVPLVSDAVELTISVAFEKQK